MTYARPIFVNLTTWLLLGGLLLANGEARTWKSANGSYSVDAELVTVEDGIAVLKRDDNGQVIRVPLDKLSEADQLFAKLKTAEQDKAPGSKAPMPKAGTEEKPAAAAETKPAAKTTPEAKRGAYTFTVPKEEAIGVQFYKRACDVYGVQLKPDFLKRMQEGELRWIEPDKDKPLTYEVVVPETYSPEEPMGLFVYISASAEGTMPARWKPVLEKHRLIWVGPNNCGNAVGTEVRHAITLDAAARMNKIYALDPDRIYVSGSSGGGRVASQVMITDADIFTGGFPHVGCNAYRPMPAEKAGAFYPTIIKNMSKEIFNLAKQRNRFVFLTGSKDFNRFGTIGVHKIYQQDGFQHLTYLEVPGMGHGAPDAEWFEKGMVALDAPLHAAAESQYQAATKAMNRNQLGPALEGFRRAVLHGEAGDYVADAKEKFRELHAQYESEVSEIQKMIEANDFSDAIRSVTGLKRQWGPFAEKEGQRLIDEITAARKASR